MSYALEGGTAPHPGVHALMAGDLPPEVEVMLDCVLPRPATKSVWLFVFARTDDTVFPAANASTWTKVIDGEGASGLFLDGYGREADGTEGAREGDQISFFSPTTQELQGALVIIPHAVLDNLIFRVVHASIVSQDDPEFPQVPTTTPRDTVLCCASVGTVVTAAVSEELDELDTYSSSEAGDEERTFTAAQRTAGATGQVDPGTVTFSGAVSGRRWSVCVRFTWRGSRHAAPIHAEEDITNPSLHARRTP
jgi:hypothetical protein